MEEKRARTGSVRLGMAPESFGTCELYVGAAVSAPWKGSQTLYPGMVQSADFQNGTVEVAYDDGDHDCAVKVATLRFQNGAQAKLPPKRHNKGAGQQLKMKPKKVQLRLPTAKRKRDWALHKVISVQILPPRVGEDHYDNVHERFMLGYQWLWAGERHEEAASFPASRVSQISLRDVLQADANVCGMYLVALRHFIMDMATGAPMNAIAAAHMFGQYDPIAH